MAKPEQPTVFAYGMREVGNGKWEAFRARVPVSSLEALTPVHKTALKDSKWHTNTVPDPKATDVEAPRTILRPVLGEVETGKFETKRGEREDLALSRFHEAERLDRAKLRLDRERARLKAAEARRVAEESARLRAEAAKRAEGEAEAERRRTA